MLYTRLPCLLQELHIARGDGRYGKVLAGRARMELLYIDDWGLMLSSAGSSTTLTRSN
jgi:DNA replication protein DnaC